MFTVFAQNGEILQIKGIGVERNPKEYLIDGEGKCEVELVLVFDLQFLDNWLSSNDEY